MGKEKFPAESTEEKKTGAIEANFKNSAPAKKINLIFKHNRSYELHIAGRIVARFEPNASMELDSSVLNHPDFTDEVKNLFTVKEL